MILECLRHIDNPRFNATIFRKNATQIFVNGGLWDTAMEILPLAGGVPCKTPKPMFKFPSGAKITFAHLERYQDSLAFQGSQIPLICFDELTHFSEEVFWYMLSRNRSTCGVKPYIRCTTNPMPDTFVAKLISWWIDQETGYAIPERSGIIRYFARRDGELIWGDTREEVINQVPGVIPEEVKSFTFIASKLEDNQILMNKDPGYLANLKALPLVEQERLLNGNWKIVPAAGLMFKRVQATMVDTIPSDVIRWVRAWDMAATEKDENGEAAYTAGVLIGKRKCGRWIIGDVINQQLSADKVRKIIKDTAAIDKAKYKKYKVRLNQDPGQAGKEQAQSYMKMLAGFSVSIEKESGDKVTRAEPLSAQWQAGNVDVLIAEWNDIYFNQLESFPDGKWKDMVDASGTAFAELEKANTAAPPPEDIGNTKTSYWSS